MSSSRESTSLVNHYRKLLLSNDIEASRGEIIAFCFYKISDLKVKIPKKYYSDSVSIRVSKNLMNEALVLKLRKSFSDSDQPHPIVRIGTFALESQMNNPSFIVEFQKWISQKKELTNNSPHIPFAQCAA